MRVSFTPQRRDDKLSYSVQGDVLTVNGEVLDFSPLNEGDLLPKNAIGNAWIASDVTRENGEIHLTLIEPQGAPK